MVAYYNDNDPRSAAILNELVNQRLIPYGEVDDRSICDVMPEDLVPFNQVHFFAGIGGWPLALMLAGWNNHDIWSGSCPCQPFSIVGNQKGIKDDRHLWPEMRRLIQARKPVRIVGEQVAGKAGTEWFDIVASDLENDGYAYGGVVMSAKIFGIPHKRERLYWMAHATGEGLQGWGDMSGHLLRKDGRTRTDTTAGALWAHMFGMTGKPNAEQIKRFGAFRLDLNRSLMGYPRKWALCMVTATQSSSRKPKPSVKSLPK